MNQCLHVIHELGRDQDTGDEQSMNIERIDGQSLLSLGEPVQVDIGDHKARGAAIGVLENPLQVAVDWDCGLCEAVEDRELLRLEPPVQVVGLGYPVQHVGKECYHSRHRFWALELWHCCNGKFVETLGWGSLCCWLFVIYRKQTALCLLRSISYQSKMIIIIIMFCFNWYQLLLISIKVTCLLVLLVKLAKFLNS